MSDQPKTQPNGFPLISMRIAGKRAEALGVAGKSARIWLHPDGSVTWELVDKIIPKRRWWQRS